MTLATDRLIQVDRIIRCRVIQGLQVDHDNEDLIKKKF